MEITNLSLDWDSDDAYNLRLFLNTKTGGRFLPKLLEHIPELLSSGETNDILIRNGEVRGCQLLARTILSMTAVQAPTVEEQIPYPALEDDAKWNDGQTLKPEPETEKE